MFDSFNRLRFYRDHKLVAWHPEGVLDLGLATQVVDFLTFQEKVLGEPFNRFTDWEGISEVRLSVVEINDLVARRRATYGTGPHVKSAFLAPNLATYGIAWLFSILMEGAPIEVRVFREIETAAQWLNVSGNLLQPE